MLITACLGLALLTAQDAGEVKTDPEAAAKEIREALKGKDPEAAAGRLTELGRMAHPAVVKAVAEGLHSKDQAVAEAALAALRFNEAPESLDPLLKLARDKKAMAEPQFATQVYFALGQKGDPKILPVLADGLIVDNGGSRPTQARVLAMGRVRRAEAVEELMGFLVKGKGFQQHPYWREVNLALAALTGQDLGGRDQWQAWWNDHKSGYKVEAKEPKLAPRLDAQWRALWTEGGERRKARER